MQGDSHPAGGARAEGLLRKARPFGASRPSRGDQSPHVPPCPPGGISISAARRAKEIVSQRGLPRPGPPAVRGGIWASATPWIGCSKWGPKGSLEPSTNLVAGQAAGPLEMPGASQNCPQPYQGESGGLEPSTKPVAGQAGATLHNLSP